MKRERKIVLGARIYNAMLKLYPREFREAYGAVMLQAFRDECREATGRLWMVWARSLCDLLVNACAERLAQMRTRAGMVAALKAVGGVAALMSSAVLLAWITMAITVFLLIPWDVGIPPAGTFAETVNNFFESKNATLISKLVILLEVVAFARYAFSGSYRLTALYWRFAVINVTVAVVSVCMALCAMGFSRLIFPNMDVWEGDQSYGVALIYWGLLIVGVMIAFFARLAWRVPTKSRLVRLSIENSGAT